MKQVKFIPILILVALLLSMCNVPLQTHSFCNFSTRGKYVLCGADTIAVLTAVEYGMKKDRMVKELTFKVLDNSTNVDIDKLLRYLTREQNGWEIELNFDIE